MVGLPRQMRKGTAAALVFRFTRSQPPLLRRLFLELGHRAVVAQATWHGRHHTGTPANRWTSLPADASITFWPSGDHLGCAAQPSFRMHEQPRGGALGQPIRDLHRWLSFDTTTCWGVCYMATENWDKWGPGR